ncbi:unnamed protein product [Polarella glacialis]|uniref:SET domain-containing protein n=1 Tax=Polarella glacialis TaxID=89957 RepID=A0A813FKC2_POLGL|nr:unnamed protein product [Polarella glacialis]
MGRSSAAGPFFVKEEHRDILGRCLVATRPIEAGEVVLQELPLLCAETDSLEDCLRGFCEAAPQVQRAVLDMHCVPLDDASDLVQGVCLEVSRLAKEPWALASDAPTLHSVWVIFQLNAHNFGASSMALFELGSKLAHACESNTQYTSQRHPGFGSHVALRPIAEGELITTNYVSVYCIMSTPRRQALLVQEKLFRCLCDRCVRPDAARSVPCPGCHPRVALHADEGSAMILHEDVAFPSSGAAVSYAVPFDSDSWWCPSCSRRWTAEEVYPPDQEGTSGAAREAFVEDLSLSFDDLIGPCSATAEHSLSVDDLGDVFESLTLARRSLGCRHWATVKLIACWCHCMSQHMRQRASGGGESCKSMGPEPWGQTRSEDFAQMHNHVWAFCAEALTCPLLFSFAFADIKELAAQALPPLAATCELLCRTMHEVIQVPGRSLSDQDLLDAASLNDAGNAAFHSTRFGEALLFYRGAQLLIPAAPVLHSNVSAALEGLHRHREAETAARHCIRSDPQSPEGHLRLAVALSSLGDWETAFEAAKQTSELSELQEEEKQQPQQQQQRQQQDAMDVSAGGSVPGRPGGPLLGTTDDMKQQVLRLGKGPVPSCSHFLCIVGSRPRQLQSRKRKELNQPDQADNSEREVKCWLRSCLCHQRSLQN